MAIITNYATLQTAISDYLNNSTLTTFLPNFTQNAEGKLYKKLRIRAMENALSVTIAAGVAAVPTSPAYLELKHAYVDVSPVVTLKRVPAQEIYAMFPVRSGGATPQYIANDGDNFIFGPYPNNVAVKGIYYGRLPALSASNATNWFTTNAPDLLLYASLLEAETFLVNDPRIAVWRLFYQDAFDAVAGEETRQRSSGGKLATRTAVAR